MRCTPKDVDPVILKRMKAFGRAPTAVVRSLVNQGRPKTGGYYTTGQILCRLRALEVAGKVRSIKPFTTRMFRWELV
jgi:hypothetical protein